MAFTGALCDHKMIAAAQDSPRTQPKKFSPEHGMASKGRMFAGCTVALVTPFRDGEVDYQGLEEQVDWQIAQGTHVLSPVGTTGEAPTLSHDEHERVLAAVVERA